MACPDRAANGLADGIPGSLPGRQLRCRVVCPYPAGLALENRLPCRARGRARLAARSPAAGALGARRNPRPARRQAGLLETATGGACLARWSARRSRCPARRRRVRRGRRLARRAAHPAGPLGRGPGGFRGGAQAKAERNAREKTCLSGKPCLVLPARAACSGRLEADRAGAQVLPRRIRLAQSGAQWRLGPVGTRLCGATGRLRARQAGFRLAPAGSRWFLGIAAARLACRRSAVGVFRQGAHPARGAGLLVTTPFRRGRARLAGRTGRGGRSRAARTGGGNAFLL